MKKFPHLRQNCLVNHMVTILQLASHYETYLAHATNWSNSLYVYALYTGLVLLLTVCTVELALLAPSVTHRFRNIEEAMEIIQIDNYTEKTNTFKTL